VLYLFGGFLDELMLVHPKRDDHPHELIQMRVVFGIGDAARLNDEEALKGVDYFLNLLPLVGTLANLGSIAPDDLIDAFVFFNEDEEQVMRGLAHFCLGYISGTFSSESSAMICGKS
jgi:hypothetical protein